MISTTLPSDAGPLSGSGRVAISKPFPGNIGNAGPVVDNAGQDKQEVAQAIQVDDQGAGNVFARLTRQLDGQSLGAAADGPCQVDVRGRRLSARQNKLGERLQLGFERVDRGLEAATCSPVMAL